MLTRNEILREFAKLYLPLGVFLVAIVMTVSHIQRQRLHSVIEAQLQSRVLTRSMFLRESISYRFSDMLVLADMAGRWFEANPEGSDSWRELVPNFSSIAHHDPLFQQVRLQDETGRELVRINKSAGGEVSTVPSDMLQDKGDRPYFQNAKNIVDGIYVSSLSLNVEHGQVEMPLNPVVRLAAPVRLEGRLVGVVVVNLSCRLLNERLNLLADSGQGRIYMVNQDGYWLIGPNADEEWGFQLPGREGYTIAAEYPDLWRQLQDASNGQLYSEAGLTSFATAWPPSDGQSLSPAYKVHAADRWIVFSIVEPDQLIPVWRTSYIIATMLGLLVLGVCCWFWGTMRAERRHNERRYQAIFDQTFQFTGLLSPDGTLLEANRTALEFGGFSRESAVGKPFWTLGWWDIGQEGQAQLQQAIRDAAQGAFVRYEVDVKSASGSLVPIDFSLRPVTDDDGKVMLLIPEGRVISELKAEREAIEQSRQLFANAFDYAPIGKALLELDGTWIQVNQSLCQIVGYSREELLQLTFQDITHPDDLDSDLANVKKLLAKEIQSYSMEKRYYRKDGVIVWVLLTGSLVLRPDGAPLHFIAQIQDITEARRLNKELDRSNRDLAQFAYIASHDLQEPLRMVSSFVALIDEKLADSKDEEMSQYISYAIDGSERMQTLIKDLLRYSRTSTKERQFEAIKLNDLVDIALAELDAMIQESQADLQVESLGEASVDPTMMKQVFENLIANAIKFRKANTTPTIRISASRTEDSVTLSIADNGMGIDPKHGDTVFQVFKRLNRREEYPGSGIGLAVCQRVVERHGGTIWFESTPGAGTTFFISLPLYPEKV